jgi:hypothetical protein
MQKRQCQCAGARIIEGKQQQKSGADYACALTFRSHANVHAFAQTATLTFASHIHIDITAAAVFTVVHRFARDAPTKEA